MGRHTWVKQSYKNIYTQTRRKKKKYGSKIGKSEKEIPEGFPKEVALKLRLEIQDERMKGWRGALQAGRGQMMWSPVGPIKELRFTLRVNLVCYLEQRKKCRNHDEYVSKHNLPKSGSSLLPPFIFFFFLWWKNFNSYKSRIVEWISIFPLSSFIHDQLMSHLYSQPLLSYNTEGNSRHNISFTNP